MFVDFYDLISPINESINEDEMIGNTALDFTISAIEYYITFCKLTSGHFDNSIINFSAFPILFHQIVVGVL